MVNLTQQMFESSAVLSIALFFYSHLLLFQAFYNMFYSY